MSGEGVTADYEASLYWEHPVNSKLALVAAPWIENRPSAAMDAWRGEAVLALKTPLDRDGREVSALQAGLLLRSDVLGCSPAGFELRWLGGASFPEIHQGFINLEAVSRIQGGCGGERYDLTVGFRPKDNWLALGQVFADLPQEGGQSIKVQVSTVRFPPSGGPGLQIGLRAPVDGNDSEAPLSLVLALWR